MNHSGVVGFTHGLEDLKGFRVPPPVQLSQLAGDRQILCGRVHLGLSLMLPEHSCLRAPDNGPAS